ncbi:nuclease-related domain-containing DEAD/DEAH box helicase [Bacillus mobilis]|nr:NERD domain-containing protein/DEAD/DEAH box helicase [Bacillus mobilis]MCU5591781.1 NERD domain-containing protein [Bacillus mobilis]MCU5736871.1 NERD domain-containing protein [Bacillus mobilis]MCU9557805.1 NERD domain-containing protein [Bacillus mobilis]SME06464.1 Nuclease-related domain protein [Bacillus mobilis]
MSKIFESFNQNDPRTAGEERLLQLFRNSTRFEEWIIFEQPHINSMKPDFVLLHPERGIVIIEVKDWNLNSSVYESGAYIRGTDGRAHKKNPINQVENYKDGILKSELQNSVYLAENHGNYYGCIETVVYFHGVSKEQALAFCRPRNNYTKIWTDEDLSIIYNVKNKLKAQDYTYALTNEKSRFNENGLLAHLVEELNKHLQYADYNLERKQPYVLTRAQRDLAELNPGSIRRWSGVAGSGKSLVLAEKAVKALKDDKRVLVVTFNITLRHYLRDLCSQQFGVASYKEVRRKLREDLTIVHFHGLLKTLMAEHEIALDIQEEQDDVADRWMDAIRQYVAFNKVKKHFQYDYILIDEGQDFKRDWILFLKQFFTQRGELFIVYDKAQDLFGRFEKGVWIEEPEQVKSIGFKGKPGNLKYTHRLPDTMVQKIHRVREQLQIEGEEILVARQEQGNLLQTEFWYNCQASLICEKLAQLNNHINLLRETNDWEDITILTTNEHTGAAIVEFFEGQGIKTSHVYDLQRGGDIDRRRSEKWKFHGGTGRLKVCSYHSYKGWQTPNVILVLDSPSTRYLNGKISFQTANQQQIKNALFISMSRVKGKSTTGEYSFVCLNYLQEYNHLKSIFS